MSDRPSKQITLPDSGAVITFFSYLTFGEYRQIMKAVLKNIEIEAKPSEVVAPKLSAMMVYEEQDMVFSILIQRVMVSGKELSKEEYSAFVSNLSIQDGTYLFNELDKVSENSRLTQEAKKK